MTSLTNIKTNSNIEVSENSRDYFSRSYTTKPYKKISQVNKKISPHINFYIGALFSTQTFLKIPDQFQSLHNTFTQSTVLQERVRKKISLKEACSISINTLHRYEQDWNAYLKEETNSFFSDEF